MPSGGARGAALVGRARGPTRYSRRVALTLEEGQLAVEEVRVGLAGPHRQSDNGMVWMGRRDTMAMAMAMEMEMERRLRAALASRAG